MSKSSASSGDGVVQAQLKNLFSFFDKNKDGYIDTSEIGSVLRALGNNPTDDEIHEIIETWDRNRDGKINFDEFTDLISREIQGGTGTDPREIIESFRIFDLERTGYISTAEFERIMTTMGAKFKKEQVDQMLKYCDTNNDGRINYEVFVDMVVNAPNNLGLLQL